MGAPAVRISDFKKLASQEEPGGARRSQEEPGGARRSQEQPGGARRSQEEPGGARRSQEEPGGAMRGQEEEEEQEEYIIPMTTKTMIFVGFSIQQYVEIKGNLQKTWFR